jgi:hypothetical protein
MGLDPLVFRPRWGRASGRILEEIRARQEELVGELRHLDEEVDRLVERRHEIVMDLRRCRDAVGGVGIRWMPREPLPGEVDAEPRGTRALRGGDLRSALRQILAASSRGLTIDELHRGLLARGVRPSGRASKAISDALRCEVRHGRVDQVGRGEYVSVAA